MNKQRIEKLQAMLSRDRADCVLYADSGNMQYFLDDPSFFFYRMSGTGGGRTPEERAFNGHFARNPDRILYIPAIGEPVLFVTHNRADSVSKSDVTVVAAHFSVMRHGLAPYIKGRQRVAVGQSCDKALGQMVKGIDETINISDGEIYGEILRKIKDEREIEKLRSVAAFTDKAMGRITKALVPGVTPLEIKALIGQIALENDLGLSFDPGVIYVHAGAPGSDVLFSCPLDSPLREGTSVAFDYGFIMDGYCSDYGRSFYLGRNPEIREVYKILHDAQLDLLSKIKPGVGLNICYDTLYSYLEPLGWGPHLRRHAHNLMGHQIGIDVHERPWMRDDEDEAVFLPVMVMCVEPKIWWPGKCYLRCEDMVLVTETGCQSLTTYDRGHFEL